MEINDVATKWKWLKSQISLIKDETLKKVIFAELRKRAFEELGFDPENTKINTNQKIILDDWEKELLEDIQKQKIYEIDTRTEKRKQTAIEAKNRMYDFIESGGSFKDLPEDLQNKHIAKLYLDTFIEIIKNNLEILEKKPLQDLNKTV